MIAPFRVEKIWLTVPLKALYSLKREWWQWWHLDTEAVAALMEATAWADGLRGIATLGVVSSHLVLCFARSLARPCCGQDDMTPKLFQRPIFRLIAAGHSWVAIFLVLLGFVNSLKPLKLIRSGKVDTALSSVATASFRRTFRLILPCTLATTLAWFACQLGLMENARYSDAWWLYVNTPMPTPSWPQAVNDLFTALMRTWLFRGGEIVYNQPQWTMVFLLQGSMLVFASTFVVANLTPKWRGITLGLLALWSTNWSLVLGDPLVGFTCFNGMILAELALSKVPGRLAESKWTIMLAGWLIITALVLMSMPASLAQNAVWSQTLYRAAEKYFPHSAIDDISRTWGSIGAVMLTVGVILSPHARYLLSAQPLAWLGKISFPVFLLHPLFMQTVMPIFAFSSNTTHEIVPLPDSFDADGTPLMQEIRRYRQRGNAALAMSVVIVLGCTCAAAHFWILKIEPYLGRITSLCEEVMTGRSSAEQTTELPRVRQDHEGHGVQSKEGPVC